MFVCLYAFLETESHYVVLAGLELAVQTSLSYDSQRPACLSFQGIGIKGMPCLFLRQDKVSVCSPDWPRTCHINQAALKFMVVFLPLDYKHVSPHLAGILHHRTFPITDRRGGNPWDLRPWEAEIGGGQVQGIGSA